MKVWILTESWFLSEEETLLPPYTSVKMSKSKVESSYNYYEVDVAKDNQSLYKR